MSNKNSVENFLLQIFGTELDNSASVNVVNVTEDWINTSQKSLQVLFDNYTPDETITADSSNDIKMEFPEAVNAEVFSDKEFEQLFRMKRSTVIALDKEINNTFEEADMDINLLICLWILGTTKSFSEMSIILKVKQEKLYELCEEYFHKIISISSKYVFWPNSTEILSIEKGFSLEYGFPGIVGIIGSLHLAVYVPREEPESSKYFNKSTSNFTIVLQAVCDNNLLFRDIFAGHPGSYSIETILKASSLYSMLTDENAILTKTKKHLLGGTEHPQLPTLLTPYSIPKCRKLSNRELKFNSLHGSVMYTVEKTFRMVESRFPRMKSLDTTSPKFASLTAAVICILHNFCRLRDDNSCC